MSTVDQQRRAVETVVSILRSGKTPRRSEVDHLIPTLNDVVLSLLRQSQETPR